MSIETFEMLTGRKELYQLIDEGLEAADSGNNRGMEEKFSDIRRKLNL